MSSLSSVCDEYRKVPDWHFKLVMFSQVRFDVESGLRANPPVFPSAFVTVCFMFTSLSQCHFTVLIINQHLPVFHTNLNYIKIPNSQGIAHSSFSQPFSHIPCHCSRTPCCKQSLVTLPLWSAPHTQTSLSRPDNLDEFQAEPWTDHFWSPHEKSLQTINIHKWEGLSWAYQHFTHYSSNAKALVSSTMSCEWIIKSWQQMCIFF